MIRFEMPRFWRRREQLFRLEGEIIEVSGNPKKIEIVIFNGRVFEWVNQLEPASPEIVFQARSNMIKFLGE